MSANVKPKRQGWVHIMGATKWHYVAENHDGKSLCGNWLYLGRAEPEDDNHESKDNCRACQRKRVALRAREDSNNGR